MKHFRELVFGNTKGCKLDSILSMVFIALESLSEIMIPFIMAKLIDEGINVGDFETIKKYSLYIFIFVILQVCFGSLCARHAVRASTIFAYNLRDLVFKRIQTFSFANIDKFSTGSLVTRTTSDVVNIKQSYQMTIRGLIRGIIMVICSSIAIFKINKDISKFLLLAIPFIFISFIILSKIAIPFFEKVFKGYDEMNNILSENIRAIRVVKSFAREDFEDKKFKKISKFIYDYFIKAQVSLAFWMPLMSLALYACNVVICYFGTLAIIKSGNIEALGLTTGELMSLIAYSQQMLMSLMMVSFMCVSIIMSITSLKRIEEILEEVPDIRNKENPIKEFKNYNITFNNVSFKYKEKAMKDVLSNINIEIKEGETIGIIGATGSGKSTFVNLIPRLYDVKVGEIKVGDINIKDYDIETLRSKIGMVLQKNVLFSGTVRSNMKFGDENVTDEEINEALKIANAYDFVYEKKENLSEIVEQGGTNFSGGQRQRLCIARSIVKKPKILIFDDSTASVDTKTDREIREALKDKLKGITKIIISQKVLSIIDCDKIILIDDGKILDFDTNENLLKNSTIYKEIYDLQMKEKE